MPHFRGKPPAAILIAMATGASTDRRRFQFRIWDLLYVTTLVAIFLAIRRIDVAPFIIPYGLFAAELLAVVGLTSAFASQSPSKRLWRMAIRGGLASAFLTPIFLWLPTLFLFGRTLGPVPPPALLLVFAVAMGPVLGVVVSLGTWWLHWHDPLQSKRRFALPAPGTAAVDPDWLCTSLGENPWVTDRVRLIVQLAAGNAVRDGCSQVEPRHLLLAMAEEGGGVAAFILKQRHVSAHDVRQAMGRQRAARHRAQKTVPIVPLSSAAKSVLRDAELEAIKVAHGYVGSEHLLLALARQGEETMLVLGLTLERVQRDLLALLGNRPR